MTISPRAAQRLRDGHPWIYRSDVAAADGVAPGALVRVFDKKRNPLGSAFYSSASQIALRLLTPEPLPPAALPALLRSRVEQAIAYRRRVVSGSDAYRLIYSEGDELPGFIVDRYNDLLVVQALTQAADQPAVKEAVVGTLQEMLSPAAIVERVDARIRRLEQLPPAESRALHGKAQATVFTMNGNRFQFDPLAGQKTGAFLDQRENYGAARHYARGHALDAFCYQGGFALHLAQVCESVAAVDSSRPALEVAEQNQRLNSAPEIEWIEANAFDLLKDWSSGGRRFDTIVLDPPPFARTRKSLPDALRAYKELNLRALRMLRPEGLLVTCSCSYHVSEAEFAEMLASAALDAHRRLRVLERRGQSQDHPVVLTIPETAYLKCFLCLVD